jgi:hypothetical protein
MRSRAALILVLLAGGIGLGQSQTSTNAADNRQTAHTPTLLWKTFPLRQQAAPRSKSRSQSGPPGRNDRSRNWLWVLIATATALSVAATGVANRLRRSRQRGVRNPNDELQQEQGLFAEQQHVTGAKRVMGYLATTEAASPDSEFGSSTVTEDESVSYRGEQLNSVLGAAKAAAARIEEEARHEGKRVRDRAQREATERRQAAHEEARAMRVETERLRSEADEWSKQTRAAAESSAADLRGEAEAEARDILSAAERQAASFSENAERRQQALKMEISSAEDRLRHLTSGLHELAERIDMLLSTPLHEAREGMRKSRTTTPYEEAVVSHPFAKKRSLS